MVILYAQSSLRSKLVCLDQPDDTFGFESQYFDKGLGKVLTGLEQRVVSGLQQAASVVDEYPSQAPKGAASQEHCVTRSRPNLSSNTYSPSFATSPAYAGLSDAENTVAFWRLFDLQKRKGSLEEVKQSLQNLSLEQDVLKVCKVLLINPSSECCWGN
ncbi:MAG: hypothetical protein FRX48_09360 [Lasallia pustulata]|uniref:Uncharacterized protein n=1 Tax=Lasallia pustulata TaxID=136370 RepID=A0A5M8PDP2_9LECA|nr:MAG: hypothetical protein FRX48_09360 [Lasallia pustulata]